MNTILVCDDDKEIVEAIEIYLSQEGYRVLKAYDGAQAVEMLEKNEVQLLIIDIMMPRRNPRHAENTGEQQHSHYYTVGKI